ncbi:MAG: DUF433 domain-containing protein [Acetobacteraceae bacterium]
MPDHATALAAFSEAQVEALTKLSRRRLRYWAGTGFFAPSYLHGNSERGGIRIYSFRDIVALRTLEMLRVQNGVPLQHLRRVAEKLSESGLDVWCGTVLWVMNRRVIFQPLASDRPQEVVSGQYVMEIPLRKVVDDTTCDVAAMRRRKTEDMGAIKKSAAIAAGPVVAGTRVRVASIKRLHEDGYDIGDIRREYPDLTDADIAAALAYKPAAA